MSGAADVEVTREVFETAKHEKIAFDFKTIFLTNK